MTCEGKIYVGQIGVRLEITTWIEGCPIVDWSTATTTDLIMLLPNKVTVTLEATVEPDGHTLVYVTDSADDLPLKGTYKVQAHVVGASYNALGETATFVVHEAFK